MVTDLLPHFLTGRADRIVEGQDQGAEYPFCQMDDITLKTMIRSNPGLILIRTVRFKQME